MVITTTDYIEGKKIKEYLGIVNGEVIIGANFLKDFFVKIRDVVGGRSSSYEGVLRDAKKTALEEMESRAKKMNAEAIIGLRVHYQSFGASNTVLMVAVTGTAVRLEYRS